jgi:integrase
MAGVARRPSKLTPALADDLVLLLAAGATSARAARAVGVSARSVRRWLRYRPAGCRQDQDPVYYILFVLLAFTGLRIREALALTWADVDMDAGVIQVERQLAGDDRRALAVKTANAERELPPLPAPAPCARLAQARFTLDC